MNLKVGDLPLDDVSPSLGAAAASALPLEQVKAKQMVKLLCPADPGFQLKEDISRRESSDSW